MTPRCHTPLSEEELLEEPVRDGVGVIQFVLNLNHLSVARSQTTERRIAASPEGSLEKTVGKTGGWNKSCKKVSPAGRLHEETMLSVEG